ncbi:molybdopterin-dependent oxidoreductase [Thermodesulfatator atlanticus]
MKRREFLKLNVAGFVCWVAASLEVPRVFAKASFRPVLIWDKSRCLGCRACMAACQLERGYEPEEMVLKLNPYEEGTPPEVKVSFKREVCRQCQEPTCVEACAQKALSRLPSGVVEVNQERCVGCGDCVEACPYQGVSLFEGKAIKCDLCLDLVKEGQWPRCAAVCPSGALVFGNLASPTGTLAKLLAANPALLDALRRHLNIAVPKGAPDKPDLIAKEPHLPEGVRLAYTTCLACNARCGLRVWVKDDEVIRVEGNPYHPYNRAGKHIPYETPLKDAILEKAGICAKPLFDNDYLKNPYRIRVPLKRNGPRGSGKFVPISWETLIKEIAEGGKLFAHLGDDTYYPGIKDVLSDEPIDPSAPELGPKRNQLIWITGRSQAGRKHFIKRFVNQAVGSKNCIGHTDICGLGFRMGNYAFSDGKQVEFKADFLNAEYILVFGANLYAALQPSLTFVGSILADRVAQGKLKFVVIDPRAHEATHSAAEWIPVKPGKDGALALGILRVLLEEGLFDRDFLSIPSLDAAKKKIRNVFTNATHLVVLEGDEAGRFLRAKDLPGLSGDEPVVVKDGRLVPASKCLTAQLEWEGEVSGKKVKTAFLLFKESVFEHPLSFYAQESGVDEGTIRRLAHDFARHGAKSVAFAYHGGGNYVGGAYASYAIALLNALAGNVNLKGGYLCPGKGAAPWRKGLYDLKKFPGAKKPKGIKISREKAAYEKTSEFRKNGYPSKLPWFPFTKGGLSLSALAGIDQAYPYPAKILFTYFYNPVYTTPGGRRFIETLKCTKRVPLHVSIDVTVNETNIYADYIVPDITYLEGQYGFLTPHAPGEKFTAVRTPLVLPKTGQTKDGRPFCLETFLIDLAVYLGLPGFGPKAIPGKDGLYPLYQAEDYYLRGIANLAYNAKVKPASKEEQDFVAKNYLVAQFEDLLPEDEWQRVCTVLVRGGVFYPSDTVFDSRGNFKAGIPKVCLWNEKLALSRNSLTGNPFWGTVRYEISRDAFGSSIAELDKDFPLTLISHKTALHTQSRTICYRKALVYEGEPHLLLNPKDAKRLGLKDGQSVRVWSRSFKEGLKAKVKISSLVRPGCSVYPFHYGHTQHGASSLIVKNGSQVFLGGAAIFDGMRLIPDEKRKIGFNPNVLSRLDESLFNLPLVDLLGGIPDFSSTRIKISKI